MHPPLHRDHPDCSQAIKDLLNCHEDNSVGKWYGKCNDMKALLDQCLRKEKDKKRSHNLKKAQNSEEEFLKYRLKIDTSVDNHTKK